MIIAVDFDGTCVTHEYPNVGKDIGAIPVLRELIEQGHQIILWTMRSNETLFEAELWLKMQGVELFGVNINPNQHTWTESRKAYAQLYIDDAALGCPIKWDEEFSKRPFVDWDAVREILIGMNVLKLNFEPFSEPITTN